jgi:hypothetical protein
VKTEIREEWVAALRSGEYRQGIGKLRGSGDTFCCLGVLCDLAEKAGIVRSHNNTYSGDYMYYFEDGTEEKSILPITVQEWAGLPQQNPYVIPFDTDSHSLAECNDEGMDFNRIADLIEKQL